MLKFQTPVRGCNITAMVDEKNVRHTPQEQASKIQVQTVAEVKPTECTTKCVKEKIEIKDIISESAAEKIPIQHLIPSVENNKSLLTSVKQNSSIPEAVFVRDTITDGTKFEPNAQFVQVWTLKNPGPEAWPAGCSVRFVGGDNMLNVDNDRPSSEYLMSRATESNTIRRQVQAGEEISFRVLMKAPLREGVAISYWRLKTNDGTPFGHRLWCHINVANGAPAAATEKREVGRGVAQETFLRHFVTEQINHYQCAGLEQPSDKLEALREVLSKHSAKNGLSLGDINKSESSERKMEKVKIEVVDSTEKAVKRENAQRSETLAFPTLDMQSSASSTERKLVVTNGAIVDKVAAVASASEQTEVENSDDGDIFDDAESIDLLDDSSSDDGFLTEDEYDIVDSDSEIV